MTKHYCDFCGNETTKSYYFIKTTYNGKIKIPNKYGIITLNNDEPTYTETKEKHICPDCYNQIEENIKWLYKGE